MYSTEFYVSPNGEVMIQELGKSARPYRECDFIITDEIIDIIQQRYPTAYNALSTIYNKCAIDNTHYKYCMVHRFIRCNWGSIDTLSLDIDSDGDWQFEKVPCPLRHECPYENVICLPEYNCSLTPREKEVYQLIVAGKESVDIGKELYISTNTANRHREAIKKKINATSVGGMIRFWFKKNLNKIKI